MYHWLIDFGDVAVRFDTIKQLERGVDGTTIHCEYSRADAVTTSMPYRDAVRLYEETRAAEEASYREHMVKLASVQRVV